MICFKTRDRLLSVLRLELGKLLTRINRLRPGLILSVLLCCYVASSSKVNAPEDSKPLSITDMVAVTENGQTVIYLIDDKTKFLYSLAFPIEEAFLIEEPQNRTNLTKIKQPANLESIYPRQIYLESFKQIPLNQTFVEPSALAYHQGKLFICDKDNDQVGVYEVDLKAEQPAKPVVQIPGSQNLREPKSITISDKGVIAVGDDRLNKIILYEPYSQTVNGSFIYESRQLAYYYGKEKLDKTIDEPDRIFFVGEQLVVLETDQGKIRLLEGRSSEKYAEGIAKFNELLMEIKNNVGSIQDFAVYNGIFYITDKTKVTAFAPLTSHRDYVLLNERENSAQFNIPSRSRIIASRDYLLVEDPIKKSILKFPRPAPVTINFDLNPNQALENNLIDQRNALAILYEYLYNNGILPVRQTKPTRTYDKDLRSLLLDENVLFERPQPDRFTMRDQTYLQRLENLFCKLNQKNTTNLCDSKNRLIGSIQENQSLTLPGVKIEVDLSTSDVSLGNRTVAEHLSERVIKSQRDFITADYIQSINSNTSQTIETEIIQNKFILANQFSTALKPGTFVTLGNNKEEIVGSLASCLERLGTKSTGKNFDLLPNLPISLKGSVPRKSNQLSAETDLKAAFGIDRAMVDLKEAKTQSIEVQNLEAALQVAFTEGGCTLPSAGEDIYLINSAIEINEARYKLFGNGKQKIIKNAEELNNANLQADPSDDTKFSFIVREPFYIAYTLLKVDFQQSVADWAPITDRNEIRTQAKQNIFNETNKVLKLPATRWRLSLFINATDSKGLETIDLIRATSGINIFPEETLPLSAKSFPSSIMSTSLIPPDDPLKTAKTNRADILKLIGNYTAGSKIENVFVGVAETRSSIHAEHPDFNGVWYEHNPTDIKNPLPLPVNPAVIVSPLVRESFNIENEHGIHVAGIIASNGIYPELRGLVPGVKLFLIDTSGPKSNQPSPAALEDQIDHAISSSKVKIFNFSFTIGNEATQQLPKFTGIPELKEKFKNWSDVLFVTAAGNDGRDLHDITNIPIEWTRDIPNIIGVGALNITGDGLLTEWRCDPNRKTPNDMCRGSNYSKEHVHIVAPGRDVYSTVPDGYAPATGTSQATPFVAATAAALQAQDIRTSILQKTRLIYTTDWVHEFNGKVWGGRLNHQRALTFPKENVITFNDDENGRYTFDYKNEPRIVIDKTNSSVRCKVYDRIDRGENCQDEIPFNDILRINKYKNKNNQEVFRIIYLHHSDDNETFLKILLNADIKGVKQIIPGAAQPTPPQDWIPCYQLKKWNKTTDSLEKTDCRDINVKDDLFDYVAQIPNGIVFKF